MLLDAGVGDITTWNPSDAVVFPLHHVVFGADAVIDLVDGLPSRTVDRRSGITVITRDDARSAPFAAAGLLRAALHTPGATFDVEVYCACALALILALCRTSRASL
jgi:malate dehydrogenase (oxaloacetate-decarboxylating)